MTLVLGDMGVVRVIHPDSAMQGRAVTLVLGDMGVVRVVHPDSFMGGGGGFAPLKG